MVTGDSQEEVLIFRDKQTHMHHNIYIIIIIFLEASIKSVYLSNISPTWYMDISDPLKYDQILKFSMSAQDDQ